jgi:hypothetical protein
MTANMGKWSWQVAFRTQEDRKIRPPDGYGDRLLPSNTVREYNSHRLEGHLGNVGKKAFIMFGGTGRNARYRALSDRLGHGPPIVR